MTEKYESTPVVVDLDVILRDWAKNYKAQDGSLIVKTDYFVDVHKNKVCFVIDTYKKEE